MGDGHTCRIGRSNATRFPTAENFMETRKPAGDKHTCYNNNGTHHQYPQQQFTTIYVVDTWSFYREPTKKMQHLTGTAEKPNMINCAGMKYGS